MRRFEALRVWRAIAVVFLLGLATSGIVTLLFPQCREDLQEMDAALAVSGTCWWVVFVVAYVISVWKDPRSIGTKVWQGILWWVAVCPILGTILDVAAVGKAGPQLAMMGAVFYLLARTPLKAGSQEN